MDLQHLSRARIVLLISTLLTVTGGLSIVLLKNYHAFQSGARSSSSVSTRATSKKAVNDQSDDAVTQTNSYTIKSGMITFSYPVDWTVNETEVGDAQKVVVSDEYGNPIAFLETNLSELGGAGATPVHLLRSKMIGGHLMNCLYALQNDKYYDVYFSRSNDDGLFA